MSVASSVLALWVSAAPVGAPDAGVPLPVPERFRASVDDPLLAPVEPPATVIATWSDARTLLTKHSTDLRTAEAGVDRAAGRWRQALGVLLPNADAAASVGYGFRAPDPLAVGHGLSVGVSQSVVDVSAWRGLDAASSSRRASEASLSDVRRRVTLGLARGLVTVVAAERVAELNRLGLRQALERAALTQRTKELGAATLLDVVRVEQDAELARSALVAGDEQLLRARDTLGLVLGLRGGAAPSKEFQLDGLIDELRRVCRVIPWESRPDLVAARETTSAATASRQQATAGYLPAVRAASDLELGLTGVRAWSIGAVLSVPIWEGGIREGLVQERRGLEEQSEASTENTRRTIEVEVAQAARRVRSAEALLASAVKARALAAETDALTRRAFEVGRGSSLELVQTAQALRQADVLLATREFEWVQARLDAYLTEAQCDG